MNYSSPAAPHELDLVTGHRSLLAAAKPPRKETVKGISAGVMEMKDSQGERTCGSPIAAASPTRPLAWRNRPCPALGNTSEPSGP